MIFQKIKNRKPLENIKKGFEVLINVLERVLKDLEHPLTCICPVIISWLMFLKDIHAWLSESKLITWF